MAPRMIRPADDPVQPAPAGAVRVVVDGEPVDGVAGQTIAGVLLANGVLGWRTTARHGRPRGVFCGIGVCFDCIAEVNGLPRRPLLPAPRRRRRRRRDSCPATA